MAIIIINRTAMTDLLKVGGYMYIHHLF